MAQFDQSPSIGDKHNEGDVEWIYDGVKWVKQSPVIKTENIELSDPSLPANLTTSPLVLPPIPADTDTHHGGVNIYIRHLLLRLHANRGRHPLSNNDDIRCCRGSRGGDQLPVLAM